MKFINKSLKGSNISMLSKKCLSSYSVMRSCNTESENLSSFEPSYSTELIENDLFIHVSVSVGNSEPGATGAEITLSLTSELESLNKSLSLEDSWCFSPDSTEASITFQGNDVQIDLNRTDCEGQTGEGNFFTVIIHEFPEEIPPSEAVEELDGIIIMIDDFN